MNKPAIEATYEITPLGSDAETTIKTETLYVDINKRIQLAIDMNESGDISIRVYPITAGQYWDMPHEEFTVDMEEIIDLEKDLNE